MKFLLLALLLVSTSALARGFSSTERMQDFTQLQSLIQAEYGPLEYKINTLKIDLAKLNADYAERIQNAKTNQDFYAAIQEYVAQLRDGHFGVRIDSDRNASVPFSVELVDEKVLISYINRDLLPTNKFNFSIGDEILTVNNESVTDLINTLSKPITSGNPKNVRRKAAWSITSRSGSRFVIPTEKQVIFKIRRGLSNIVEEAKLDWIIRGTEIDENDPVRGFMPWGIAKNKFKRSDIVDQDLITFSNPMGDSRYSCNPGTRIAIPSNATIIMKEPFMAYTYPSIKGEIGYIRFPHYYPADSKGNITQASLKDWYQKLRFAISTMEQKTIGLIIDQDHNCGGSVALVEDTIALFMSEPFIPQPFRLRANKATYLELIKELSETTENTLEYTYTKELKDLVEQTWKNTNDFLTPFTPVTARKKIYPDPEARYTKPIVILIDEMAGSGGDAFPAMMKGLGRAKLFGQQTAGLGGSVNEFPALFHSRMTVRMTVTMFFKPDLSPVENNGAIPDRIYDMTRDDLMYEFKPYQAAYTNYLLEQIP